MKTEILNKLINKQIKTKNNELGVIIGFEQTLTQINNNYDLIINTIINNKNKDYCLLNSTDNGLQIIDFDLTEIKNEINNEIINIKEKEKIRQLELENLKKLELERIENEKTRKKLELKNKEFIKKLNNKVSCENNVINWLKENLVSITVSLPDYLLNSFYNYFGCDYTPNIVDSNKLTSSGNKMKYSYSFSLLLKNNLKNIPQILDYKINKNRINDTRLITTLVKDFGFKFGKKN